MTVPNTVRAARKHLAARFFPVLHYPSPEAAEWLSLRSGAWWLLLLTPALHLFGSNFLFAGFQRLAPERDWQAGLGAFLCFHLAAFLHGGRGGRAAALLLSALVWAFVAGVTGAAAHHALLHLWGIERLGVAVALATGIGVYGGLGTDCAVAAVSLVREIYTDWLVRDGMRRKAGEEKAGEENPPGGPGGTPWGD